MALLAWVAAETGLAMPPAPSVVLVPTEQMSVLAYGRDWRPGDDLRALYNRGAATVYLRDDWTIADLRSRATLMHELVHHVQEFNRTPSECPQSREPQAYDLTIRWLREQSPADPYVVLGIDEFSISIMSVCRD